jgi:5-(carboxyamino)imidazole ribonucleotide mutase
MEEMMADAAKRIDVGIIMGSKSDWPAMEAAAKVLDELGIAYEAEVISAHRTPDRAMQYAESAKARGLRVIIAGAGGAAHLAGFVAAKTTLPVLGVPMKSSALNGLDSLLSIVQMPAGIPVATFAIGEAGAKNAGLFAAAILALEDKAVAQKLDIFRSTQTENVLKESDPRK